MASGDRRRLDELRTSVQAVIDRLALTQTQAHVASGVSGPVFRRFLLGGPIGEYEARRLEAWVLTASKARSRQDLRVA